MSDGSRRASGRQAARSEATRAKLIEVGIELFSERGYAGVGTEEIVERAKVTRGALYHHFGDKRDLFRAVHEELEQRIVAEIAAALEADPREDPLEALEVAAGAVLDVALDSRIARVTLIDAPVGPGLGGVARDRRPLRARARRGGPDRRDRERAHPRSSRSGRSPISWWRRSARRRSWSRPRRAHSEARAEVEPALHALAARPGSLSSRRVFRPAQARYVHADDPRRSPQGDDHEDPRALREPRNPPRRPLGPPDRAGSPPARRRRPRIRACRRKRPRKRCEKPS